MTLRTTTRLSAISGAFLLLLGLFVAVTAEDVSAVTREGIVIGEGEIFEGEFGPIMPANAPANLSGPTAINTDICSAAPYCDVIPLTIEAPESSGEAADWFVYVTLSWPSVVVEDAPLGSRSATDLDLFIVNEPFDEEAGPKENGFAYVSASGRNPEAVTMFRPTGDFNLLIDNYASTPTNYTVKVEWSTIPLPTPFESLPPEFAQTGDVAPPRAKPSLATPARPAPTPAPVFQAPPPAPGAPNLAPALRPVGDASFDSGFDDGAGLDEQLAAPPAPLELRPVVTQAAATPPSGLALALWLLALPLLLGATGGLYLQRRQATAIDF